MYIKMIFQKYRDIIAYGFFGVCSTLVNIGMYWILARATGIPIMLSTVLAWIIAVLFAYLTNHFFVFRSKTTSFEGMFREVVSFFGCRLGTEVIDIVAMIVFVSILEMNDMIVKTVANVVVIVANYVASKLFIFKQ